MKHVYLTLLAVLCIHWANAQTGSIRGFLSDENEAPVEFANVVLYTQLDSTITKVETTGEDGSFQMMNIKPGAYFLEATCIGYDKLRIDSLVLPADQALDLGNISMPTSSVELEEAVVTAQRSIVEIKPDRTVFNVEGTINSVGDNALSLLRKAPGVLVDNSDNISILSRSGVLFYVDGKRLPLAGEDLANYLRNIPAEQIDRIDIITNPGAKYEAEGTAGIIDLRLKRDKNLGANGSVTTNYTQGKYARGNISGTGNFRNKFMNVYGQAAFGTGYNFNDMAFHNFQNGLEMDETMFRRRYNESYNYRLGTDFFINDNHTVGFLIAGNRNKGHVDANNRIEIGNEGTDVIDSILVANNETDSDNTGISYNVNYMFEKDKTTLNIDLDYGDYANISDVLQPNTYFDPDEEFIISEVNTAYKTDTDIDIYSAKVDFETEALGGKIGLGTKYTQVATDNTYLFYEIPEQEFILDDDRSNRFTYDEKVYAGYVNYARSLGKKWNISAGLRVEQTDSRGDLTPFNPDKQQPPVEQNYLSWFPSGGLTFQAAPEHAFNLNYGRRINRPDYNVLNPFDYQLSELSYQKGNPNLRPEIVNNYEFGYTLKYRYNLKLSYSKTLDAITRLIGPDDEDPRAGFITWDNLATQQVWAMNISAPIDITKKWNVFLNLNGSYTDNQAVYPDGSIVDVQAWSYNFFMQNTIKLPWDLTGEVSGWYSGPGVWGGVFKYDPTWSLNLGLQKRFFNDQLNVRMTVNDIFYESGWSGTSEFNGLTATGRGNWDSRRFSISLSLNLGNENVKSRRRKTGMESEADRLGGEN